MAKIQCKMCGGMVDLQDGMTVGECPYCGTTTTFPKLSTDRAEQQYGRAEHYRHAGEFDKAVAAYESIVRDNPDDAEAYWGLVLSRFGIEYVEDPVSHERIPTCHRVQYESILADADYKSALECAVGAERDIYEREAARIAEIQKGILAISSKEKPFDVFICYKETTDGGSRTKDSAIAQDIYYSLVNAGHKVFFSRITLEDKLGREYEPYIFAALNSAKVMLVIGTRKEYFNAVWVKNEWSRYLALMKNDRSRLLIPCYRDMDAYDIPDELSMLQALDMSKIGFIQDLLNGIGKVLAAAKSKERKDAAASSNASAVAPLLKRASLFLRTGEFDNVIQYCERVLDQDPENAQAYLYRLLAENEIKSEDGLCLLPDSLDKYKTFNLLMEFADADLRKRMNSLCQKQRDTKVYESLKRRMAKPLSFKEWKELAERFASIRGFKDADELRQKCEENARLLMVKAQQEYQREYETAIQKLTDESATPEEWEALAEKFESLGDTLPEAGETAKQCRENAITAR
ncbi:MAG: TIR domain-containing protein, partial [Victivallales bacterium]|nr:TIR domain-containing protein [Victivallales bacterium]